MVVSSKDLEGDDHILHQDIGVGRQSEMAYYITVSSESRELVNEINSNQ
jgi:hypothetical protein